MTMDEERRGDLAESLFLVRQDVGQHLMPHLTSAAAKSQAAMIVELLGMVERELSGADASAAFEAAVQTAAARLLADRPEETDTLERLETAAGRLDVGEDAREGRQAIVAIAQADEMRLTGRSRTGHDSYAESGAGTKASASAAPAPFDAATLQTYLSARPDGVSTLEVVTLRPLPGGFSKSTYLADIRRSGADEGWVLRRDLPFSPLRTFVPDEYPLLQTLHAQGFPVAEPLWCEADPTALGAATLAVRRVVGEGDMTAWSGDAPRAAIIGMKAAKLAAQLHSLDPKTLPPLQTGAPGAQADTPAIQLDHLRAFWREKRIAPNPLVELVFGWLADHLPKPVRRGLVHGDFGLHNLIVDGEEIAALLDWEFTHLGDPQEDLAYGRPFISRMMDWEAFVDAYVVAGGARPDPATLD